jgi:signal peptidase I
MLRTVNRKPWVAAVLSLLTPGLGQVYAGEFKRGAIMWCLWWVLSITSMINALTLPAWAVLLAPTLVAIGCSGAIMVDAALRARRAPRPFVPRSYNRWYAYLLLWLLVGTPVSLGAQHFIKRYLFEAFSIPTGAMAPTIRAGDYIYATSWRGPVGRGAIVVFRHDGNTFMKRVVGIAGDTLGMRNDSLYVNGRYVTEPYAIPSRSGDPGNEPTRTTWGPVIVPPSSCFVLGDNRGQSLDSRYYGFVPTDSAVKRPIGIYFSLNPTTHAIRWNRIGRDVSR